MQDKIQVLDKLTRFIFTNIPEDKRDEAKELLREVRHFLSDNKPNIIDDLKKYIEESNKNASLINFSQLSSQELNAILLSMVDGFSRDISKASAFKMIHFILLILNKNENSN